MTSPAPSHEGSGAPPSRGLNALTLSVGALLVLTTILKFTVYANQPLGLDETFTGMIAAQPTFNRLLHQCQRDVYAPLSYIVSWGWARIAGVSDAALRFPSAVFACVAPVLALAPSRLIPRNVRLTWAALLACWIPGVLFAETARCYTLLLLLGCANAIAFVWLMRGPTGPKAVVWTTISALFILDHYFAAILIGCQGLAYLAVHRKLALLTWPAALAFLPPFASVALKAPLLVSYARPGVAWMPRLQLRDLPQLAYFLAGAEPVAYAILIWAAIGLILNWRGLSIRRVAVKNDPDGATLITAAIAVVATAICLGLGFLKALVIARYLTPFVPGLLLALALLAHRFTRAWPLASAALLTVPAGLILVLAVHPPTAPLPTLAFEGAAQALSHDGVSHLVFFWDNPLAQTAISEQFAQVGGFFFGRSGHPVPVEAPRWTPGADPNTVLLADAASPGTAILWIYDLDRPGTLAIRHPPALTRLDGRFTCRDFAGGRLGVLACDRRPAGALGP
jgi:hypothetical protein